MAEGDKITTTSNIVDRSKVQETAQQVRAREAREDATHRQSQVAHQPPKVDVAACLANIEELLDNIGKETLHLHSGDELVSFLSHITFAKVDFQRLAQVERDKAMAAHTVDNEDT